MEKGKTFLTQQGINQVNAELLNIQEIRLPKAKETGDEREGKINIEQVKKEHSDLHFLIKNVVKIYDHITGGMISKIMTDLQVVIQHADEYYGQLVVVNFNCP